MVEEDVAVPNPNRDDLLDPDQLTPQLIELLGPELDALLLAAASDRSGLRHAERAWATAALAALEIDLELRGRERIDTGQSYIVAPLHEGFADVLALLQLPLDLSWVIRDELLGLPFFGAYLEAAGHIAIEPEAPRAALRSILRAAPAKIAGGRSLVVFPQGSLLGVEVAFQMGAFQLAARLDTPILPIVLTGSHRVWDYPFSRRLRMGQRVFLEVMDPVGPADAVGRMRELEREMKKRALARGDAPARRYVPARDGMWSGYRFAIDADFPEVARAAGR